MRVHDVIVVGGGPTGLMLAGELALAGVDAVVLEKRTAQGLAGARAGGLHARTIEVFDQRGLAERFLAEGTIAQVAGFALIPLDISDFPTRHPYGLALWQVHIERILADWLRGLGVAIEHGAEVAHLAQDADGVDLRTADGRAWRAPYVVGCDGGRSTVRKAAGIAFPGTEATTSNLIAEAELEGEAPWGIHRDAVGIHSLSRTGDGATVRILVTEREVGPGGPPTLEELRAAMTAAYGTDFGVQRPTWLSRFTDAVRQAAAYRAGRVLLAGDAAHVHPPDGGQGLQLGVQDAVNLGWKLARVVRGGAPVSLLDTYHAERHPVAARALRTVLAMIALRRADERTQALRDTMAELLGTDGARIRLAALLSGLDVRYDLGEGHPLLGRRMPDLDLTTGDGPARVYALLREARPVLLTFAPASDAELTGVVNAAPHAARVRVVAARCEGPWRLPVLGEVRAPSAVLVRPDGYVAWVGEESAAGLPEALSVWCG